MGWFVCVHGRPLRILFLILPSYIWHALLTAAHSVLVYVCVVVFLWYREDIHVSLFLQQSHVSQCSLSCRSGRCSSFGFSRSSYSPLSLHIIIFFAHRPFLSPPDYSIFIIFPFLLPISLPLSLPSFPPPFHPLFFSIHLTSISFGFECSPLAILTVSTPSSKCAST